MTDRIEKIIGSFSPSLQEKVLSLRAAHGRLMNLSLATARKIQREALSANYLHGDGRRLDKVPHYYSVPDGKGGTYEKETYFTYLMEVHK
jgi:hypothetical protein